jgi:hypothetical protein
LGALVERIGEEGGLLRARLIASIVLLAGLAAPGRAQLNLPPAGEVYLGIWADPDLGNGPEGAIEAREGGAPNGISRTFALHLHYYGWTALAQLLDSAGRFQPDSALAGDISHERVPVISWKCDGMTPNSDAAIAGGNPSEDAVILATASALAQYPGPVILRWFWEFNLLGNNQTCRGDTGAADFITAWRHIRLLFRSAGAANVIFLWNPGFGGSDPTPFYPGNDVVDWIGVDTYQRSQNGTFEDDFDSFYNQFSAASYGNKPLMVGENGSHAFADYGAELQSKYLLSLLADVQAGRYPLLKAYCYFDSSGNLGNWVLDTSGGLTAFRTLAGSPAFSPMPRERRRTVHH